MTFRGGKEQEHSVKSEAGVSAMSLGMGIQDERDRRRANLGEESDGDNGGAEDYSETVDNEEINK